MKDLGYRLLKIWIKSGLYLYYGKIKISGLSNVPIDAPVLFLPNHQSALMDVLLIVVDCNRKPFFLTRSDVFTKPLLKRFFSYLRMVPIYRIRDGREALKNNQAVFDQCAELFQKNHAIVMFPEANHNIRRRVRPLSKGFTRILFNAVDKAPEQAIHIVPIGLNYRSNAGFPDKVSLFYGKRIVVNDLYDAEDVQSSVSRVKEAVSNRLKMLTTHIADEENYEDLSNQLDAFRVDYLNPRETNAVLKDLTVSKNQKKFKPDATIFSKLFKGFFVLLNFPVVLIWKNWAKPKVWEPEFMATLRFGFALLVYPIYYMILCLAISLIWSFSIGLMVVLGLFFFNLVYVRLN